MIIIKVLINVHGVLKFDLFNWRAFRYFCKMNHSPPLNRNCSIRYI